MVGASNEIDSKTRVTLNRCDDMRHLRHFACQSNVIACETLLHCLIILYNMECSLAHP